MHYPTNSHAKYEGTTLPQFTILCTPNAKHEGITLLYGKKPGAGLIEPHPAAVYRSCLPVEIMTEVTSAATTVAPSFFMAPTSWARTLSISPDMLCCSRGEAKAEEGLQSQRQRLRSSPSAILHSQRRVSVTIGVKGRRKTEALPLYSRMVQLLIGMLTMLLLWALQKSACSF